MLKTILLYSKNYVFAFQKPYFCIPKTMFLYAKNYLFAI